MPKITNTRKDYHLGRRVQHCLSGLGMFLIYATFPKWAAMTILVSVILGGVWFEFMCRRDKEWQAFRLKTFGHLLRKNEINNFPGAFWFIVGSFIALYPTKWNIGLLILLIQAFGDPASSLCGIAFGDGNRFQSGKSVAGLVGGATACAMVTAMFLIYWVGSTEYNVVVLWAAVLGVVGSLAEAIPLPWDDNLTIPVLSVAAALVLNAWTHVI
eukprot:GFYU01002928.1.p1 GENE.GFYU01002928.1~~GFYU01002928.1.p1  ORF type:complete len:213 (-),score=34.11 GFYU01002928.1:206-844(-)